MKIQELITSLGPNAKEVIDKAVQCTTTEELISLAKDNQISITEPEARELLATIHPQPGELADSELDAITGGTAESQDKGPCPVCGSTNFVSNWEVYKCAHCDHVMDW